MSSGSSNQLLSPECWKVTLRVLGCLPLSRQTKSKPEQTHGTTDVSGRAVGPSASPYRPPISLSPQQVTTVRGNLAFCLSFIVDPTAPSDVIGC